MPACLLFWEENKQTTIVSKILAESPSAQKPKSFLVEISFYVTVQNKI